MPRYKKKGPALSLYRCRKRPMVFSPIKGSKKISRRDTPLKAQIRQGTPLKSFDNSPHISSVKKSTPSLTVSRTPNAKVSTPVSKSNNTLSRTPKAKSSKRKLPFSPINSLGNTRKNRFNPCNKDDENDINETKSLLDQLVKVGRFSAKNISYLIFKDTLKWHNQSNTSAMRYSENSKDFFWTGRKLLGGQFIRFMRGFAHRDIVNQGESEKGFYDPIISSINFAVPSETTLDEHTPFQQYTNKSIDPGIIEDNIDMYSRKFPSTSHVVMFDGKKIVPNSAEIFLLDLEEEPKISTLKRKVSDIIEAHQNTLDDLFQYQRNYVIEINDIPDKRELAGRLLDILSKIGLVTKSLRQSKAKKTVYLEKVEKKLPNDPSCSFAINRIQTYIHQINVCIGDLLLCADNIAYATALLNSEGHLYVYNTQAVCDLSDQQNYHELKNPDQIGDNYIDLPPNLIKQRSEDWFNLRKSVKVTGSVAYKAIGLENLASQKKYFNTVFGGKKQQTPGEKQLKAMEHGTENEENAVATLVSKIIPVLYPGYDFYEEGAYVIQDSYRKLIVVSPDGTIRSRNGEKLLSVEIKCPLPQYAGSTPVYYEMMQRHTLQCLLEIHATAASEHLYISWSKHSTTVFRLFPNNDLVAQTIEKIKNVYYNTTPKCPTKLDDSVKELKKCLNDHRLSAEFIGEFPSVVGIHSKAGCCNETDSNFSPYIGKHSNNSETKQSVGKVQFSLNDLIDSVLKSTKCIKEAFELTKPIASEVLVYLMSDMDRYWDREIGHGIPIAYMFKGYSLSMETAKQLLEEILQKCFEKVAHVPCVVFDGQFSHLKDVDINGNPLTLFSLQRQLWSESKRMKKQTILELLIDIYAKYEYFVLEDVVVDVFGELHSINKVIVAERKCTAYPPLKTPIWLLKNKVQSPQIDGENMTDNTEKEYSEIIEQFGNLGDSVVETLNEVLCNIQSTDSESDEQRTRVNPCTEQQNDGGDTTEDENNGEINNEQEVSDEHNNSGNSNSVFDGSETEKESLKLVENDYEIIMNLLCQGKRKAKWEKQNVKFIEHVFSSTEIINKEITGYELTEIIRYLTPRLNMLDVVIPQHMRKAEKVNKLGNSLGLKSSVPVVKRTVRRKVKSLQSMCKSVVNKHYTKHILSVVYCQSKWPIYLKDFFTTASVNECVTLTDNNNNCDQEVIEFEPAYTPEYNDKRRQMEVKIMDGTHIRTNIKSKIIRSGLKGIKLSAWKKVALSKKTDLSIAMLEVQNDAKPGKILHQQSDSYVRTMFCLQVEDEMIRNGDLEEAKFCRLFRNWHEAEDRPGLSAFERCKRSIALRKWLLQGYDFSTFPPPAMYVKGIPRVTFEGLVCSIDAHLLLYALVKKGTYNWRAASTLVAENFMGELAEYAASNNGVPNGEILKQDMAKISNLHAMRLNPNRCFDMQTSRARTYKVPVASDICMTADNEEDNTDSSQLRISNVIVRNHVFDLIESTEGRHGKISGFHEKPKGVQPVRYFYKVDESKILPSLRLGVPEDCLNTL